MKDLRLTRGLEARQKLIETAVMLIAADGIALLSAKRVADAAAMSKSNVFHHFPSIDDLTLATFDYIAQVVAQSTTITDHEYDHITDHANPNIKSNQTLSELLLTLGHQAFNLGPQAEVVFTALLHYYQLALINPIYKERLIAVKDHATKSLIDTLMTWANSQLASNSGAHPMELPLFRAQVEAIAENIVMNLDSLGMYHMIERNPQRSMAQWSLSVAFYCHFLTQGQPGGPL